LAEYYDQPAMTRIAPVLFLLLPVNAMCVIQNTILTRTFAFRKLSTITFLSSLVAGVVSIAIAVLGGGLWALVSQRLLTLVVKAVLLWWWGDWRPKGGWSLKPLREMFPYSSRLLATDLLNGIYNNVSSLFIGSMYTLQQLGYFSQAQKLKDLPVTSTVQAVQNVTFPALSTIRDDERKFAESYRQVLMVMAFVMIPMMAGLVAVADDMFALIGDKWRPTVPYFRVLCLTGITQPIAMVAYNILKVRSNGRIIFQLEVVKKLIMTAILVVTIPMSVEAVVWGLVVMSAIEMVVNFGATLRFTNVSVWHVVRDLLAPLAVAALMCAVVYALSGAVQMWPIAARLVVEVVAGVAIYAGGAWLLRLEGMREMVRIARGLIGKINK
jgi:O-antigen/teichoic acid export membrane protein